MADGIPLTAGEKSVLSFIKRDDGVVNAWENGNPEIVSNPGKVLVISPNGEEGYMPQENLDEALKAGYKRR
jgi:hypothetical protein